MKPFTSVLYFFAAHLLSLFISSELLASVETIGPDGINSAGLLTANGLPLNGGAISSVNPVAIGQVEIFRPGDTSFDTDPTLVHSAVDPAEVFFVRRGPPVTHNATQNAAIEIGGIPPLGPNDGHHPLEVAGIMISSATANPTTPQTPTGIAPGARLYSEGLAANSELDQSISLAMQHLATLPMVDVRAINFSAAFLLRLDQGEETDGNTLLTQFVDWSASKHDVLYVVAGVEDTTVGKPIPSDNFNGITVASAMQAGGVGKYRFVSPLNVYNEDAAGPRTSIDLLAPGDLVDVTGRGDSTRVDSGTSFATPHVTGTVALLQQYANERIVNGGWNAVNSRRHETMKAVLMNSADKIIDNGTVTIPGDTFPAPVGTFLGMERTVEDRGLNDDGLNRRNWLESEAYGDDPFSDAAFIPLDDQMGAGHLNANRAVQQFAPGEFESDSAPVPAIGWDYGHTLGINQVNTYAISQSLLGGSFISVTMAWDRSVTLIDTNSNDAYDAGEAFEPYTSFPPLPHADDVINDLDLYLVPAGMTIDDAIATSLSVDSTIEHLFFRIPTTGQYELWVEQFDADVPGGQDYAIAWWAATQASTGDYSGNGTVGQEDYAIWRGDFGSTNNLAADGNGNGVIDGGDYVVWRNNLSSGAGSGSAIPEPTADMLLLVGCTVLGWYRSRP